VWLPVDRHPVTLSNPVKGQVTHMIAHRKPHLRGADVITLVAGFVLVFFYQMSAVTWATSDSVDDPYSIPFLETNFVISHRGDVAEHPENAFSGLRFAYNCGVRLIEIDVQMTQDMIPIAFHDASLDRTTNGSGPIGDVTWSQIKGLDAGGYFSDDFSGEAIPRMSEVFQWLHERPDLVLWVHLRFIEGDDVFSALLRECSVEPQVVIQVDAGEVDRLSFYQDCLGRAAIIREPLLPFVIANIAACRAHNVTFMTVMDVLASQYLYEVTDSNGIRLMLTRNFDADESHVTSRFADGAWGYILDSARVAGEIQQHLESVD